jgi:hypothetical protein
LKQKHEKGDKKQAIATTTDFLMDNLTYWQTNSICGLPKAHNKFPSRIYTTKGHCRKYPHKKMIPVNNIPRA